MSSGRLCGLVASPLLIAILACGCGSKKESGRPEVDAAPKEELYGASHKALLYELRAKIRKRGVASVRQDLSDAIEGFEGYEKLPVGQPYKDTCKQILEKLKALQSGAPAKDAAVKAADEIGELADKLPGKAEQNPAVE